MKRDVYRAIADPTRRRIIDLLAEESMSVSEVADQFEISRPAVSKHLKILRECGLVDVTKEGRQHICRSNPAKLKEVVQWADRYRRFWNDRLDSLKAILLKEDQKR